MKTLLLIPAMCVVFLACNRECCPTACCGSTKSCDTECTAHHRCKHGPGHSADWAVTAKVKKAIMSESALSTKGRLVSVTTNSGVVRLTGQVPSKEEAHRIEKIVRDVPGVVDVDDLLTVSPP